MAITDSLLALNQNLEQEPPKTSWVQDLLSKKFATQEERLKRNPVGFEFKRDPFDPSSYYRALGTFKDISRAATLVTKQEVANREAAQRERELQQNQSGPSFSSSVSYDFSGKSRKYGLQHVTPNVARAADYWGSKYGIGSIGGWREHGSVPGSDHPKGRALDFMINNVKNGKSRGTALANDLIRNYKQWNIKYVIWNRYIWTPSRGWHRYNGPSPHTDHVHASFNK